MEQEAYMILDDDHENTINADPTLLDQGLNASKPWATENLNSDTDMSAQNDWQDGFMDKEPGDVGENEGQYPPAPASVVVDEGQTLEMREVIGASLHAQEPLLFLEQEGVVTLGELEVPEGLVLAALRGARNPWQQSGQRLPGDRSSLLRRTIDEGTLLLTEGHEHASGLDWRSMWLDRLTQLAEQVAPEQKLQDSIWQSTVVLEASVVVVKDAAAQGARGVLRPLFLRFRAGAAPQAMFALPAVQDVIHYKWTRFAKWWLHFELGLYISWLVCHCTFSLLLMDESEDDSLPELLMQPKGFAALTASMAASIAMVPFLYGEACVLREYGWGWFSVGNTLDMISYGLQVAVTVMHIQRWPVAYGWFSVMVAAQHLLLWGKLQYYARVFESTRNFRIVDTVRLVVADVWWLLVLLLLTLVGSGFAFYTMFKQDRKLGTTQYYQDHTSISHSMLSTFMYLLAMFDMSVFYQAQHPVAANLLFLTFSCLTAILLVNVLVAAMTSSYQKVREGEAVRLLQHQAQVVDEVETMIPRWAKKASWFPSYVHALRIAPRPAGSYEVDPGRLWTGTRRAEDVLLASNKECEDRLVALEIAAESLLATAEQSLLALAALAEKLETPSGIPALRRQPTTPAMTPFARMPSLAPVTAQHVSRAVSGQRVGEEPGLTSPRAPVQMPETLPTVSATPVLLGKPSLEEGTVVSPPTLRLPQTVQPLTTQQSPPSYAVTATPSPQMAMVHAPVIHLPVYPRQYGRAISLRPPRVAALAGTGTRTVMPRVLAHSLTVPTHAAAHVIAAPPGDIEAQRDTHHAAVPLIFPLARAARFSTVPRVLSARYQRQYAPTGAGSRRQPVSGVPISRSLGVSLAAQSLQSFRIGQGPGLAGTAVATITPPVSRRSTGGGGRPSAGTVQPAISFILPTAMMGQAGKTSEPERTPLYQGLHAHHVSRDAEESEWTSVMEDMHDRAPSIEPDQWPDFPESPRSSFSIPEGGSKSFTASSPGFGDNLPRASSLVTELPTSPGHEGFVDVHQEGWGLPRGSLHTILETSPTVTMQAARQAEQQGRATAGDTGQQPSTDFHQLPCEAIGLGDDTLGWEGFAREAATLDSAASQPQMTNLARISYPTTGPARTPPRTSFDMSRISLEDRATGTNRTPTAPATTTADASFTNRPYRLFHAVSTGHSTQDSPWRAVGPHGTGLQPNTYALESGISTGAQQEMPASTGAASSYVADAQRGINTLGQVLSPAPQQAPVVYSSPLVAHPIVDSRHGVGVGYVLGPPVGWATTANATNVVARIRQRALAHRRRRAAAAHAQQQQQHHQRSLTTHSMPVTGTDAADNTARSSFGSRPSQGLATTQQYDDSTRRSSIASHGEGSGLLQPLLSRRSRPPRETDVEQPGTPQLKETEE